MVDLFVVLLCLIELLACAYSVVNSLERGHTRARDRVCIVYGILSFIITVIYTLMHYLY